MLKIKPNCTNMNIENKWIHHAHIVFNKNTGKVLKNINYNPVNFSNYA